MKTTLQDIHSALSIAETYASLNLAMKNAGGIPLSAEYVKTTTLHEFIRLVAPNGVRFFFAPESKKPHAFITAEVLLEVLNLLDEERRPAVAV